jgi:hypothetical protein
VNRVLENYKTGARLDADLRDSDSALKAISDNKSSSDE